MEIEKNNKIKYLVIKENILKMIDDGKYKVGDKLPGEQELADIYQVSKITSKRSLDELEKDGYIFRVKGSGSFVSDFHNKNESNNLKMIAMVLPFGSNTGGGVDLFYGVEKIAKKNGYYVSVENTHSSCLKEREIILRLLNDNIKGIVYYPMYTSENFDLIKKLAMEKYPIVIIDKDIYDIKIDTVLCDNYNASYRITKYLINCGHRNIAFVCEGNIDERSSLRERFLGYCDALEEAKIILDIDLIMYRKSELKHNQDKKNITYTIEEIVDKVQTNKHITALQVSSDADAVKIIKLCTKKGIRVPLDISIVGFDGLDMASYVMPSLTTAMQNFKLIGQKAAELVFKRLKDRDKEAEKVLLPAEMIIRKSSTSINNK